MYPTTIDAAVAEPFAEERADDLGEPVRIVLAPTAAEVWPAADKTRLPAAWIAALAARSADPALAALGWTTLAPILPRTLATLREKLAGLGIMLPQSKPPSLLYFFVEDDDVTAYEGMLPATPAGAGEPRPPELADIQRVHDGWFDFYSGDVGLKPEAEWTVLGGKRGDGRRLVGVASFGAALAGYEPGLPEMPTRVLWSDDGTVESPPSLVGTLDEWIAEDLEDADDQRRP